MLQDLRETYIRREEPSYAARFNAALPAAAAWLATLAIFVGLAWASLKYGSVSSSEPTTDFPYITLVAE